MRRWSIGITAAVAAAAVVAVVAFAGAAGGATQSCALDAHVRLAQTRAISGNPPLSGSAEGAGTVNGKVCGKFGKGALRGVNTYPSPGKFKFTSQSFGGTGSYKSKGSGTGTPQPDGSVKIKGQGKITGGTGSLKNATGTIKITGTAPKNSTVSILHITGTVSK